MEVSIDHEGEDRDFLLRADPTEIQSGGPPDD